MKLKRGQKQCKSCGYINPARQRVCKDCSTEFTPKNHPVKGEVFDWKSLEKGQLIKVIQGTGPYYVCSKDTDDGEANEKICMGDLGVFKVMSLKSNGICAYGASRKNKAFTFLYMGEPYKCDSGICMEKYRIRRVKRKCR